MELRTLESDLLMDWDVHHMGCVPRNIVKHIVKRRICRFAVPFLRIHVVLLLIPPAPTPMVRSWAA